MVQAAAVTAGVSNDQLTASTDSGVAGSAADQAAAAAMRLQGRTCLGAGRFEEAAELFARALSLAPDDPQTELQLGIALQSVGQHTEALKRFGAAQTSMPNDGAPYLHAAASFLALGNADAVVQAASDACHRAPHLPQAHYVYGQAWLAVDDNAKAERAFADAIRLSPRMVDAWINYGIARYRQGAIEDAKEAMRKALAVAPHHAVATSNLAAFQRITGESEAAENLLRAAIAVNPQNVGARLNLAADLLQSERAEDALALLSETEQPSELRAARHWQLQRSLAFLQLHRPAEARAALDAFTALGPVPSELAPLWMWRQVLLASEERDGARARKAAAAMEAALASMGPQAVLEHQIMAHYDLAKFWSGHNEPARAFANWQAGHALLKRAQPFSRSEHQTFIDANIAAFNKSRLAQGPHAANVDPAPVFIVGMPRSGTTLCEQILAAHAQVHGAGERTALASAFATLGGGGDNTEALRRIAALDTAALDRAAAHYLAAMHALAPDKTRIVDKMPGNFSYVGLIALMLPGAKIIYCTRDPRDVGFSIFTFRFHGYHPYAHDLADLGWYIGEHGRLMDHWRAVLPGRILTVDLADWVRDFDGTLAKVLAHLDLPPDPNCARFYENTDRVRTVSYAQVRQPVNARGLGRWKPYVAELAPLIGELEKAGIVTSAAGVIASDKRQTSNPSDMVTESDPGSGGLSLWKPAEHALALGLAVEFLMKHPAFAKLPFGNWSQVLVGQINRGHFCFVIDERRRVQGFYGWALAPQHVAEAWVEDRAAPSDEDSRVGDCVIFNAWAADSNRVHRFMVENGRKIVVGKRMLYAKRYYPDGRVRPMRFTVTDFISNHLARSDGK
jgi:tetratricopeptide (TPR) repeat protein/hemolysin-activating ACP:hemolysin acyltransferase